MNLEVKLERGRMSSILGSLHNKKMQYLSVLESELNRVADHMADNAQYFTPVDEGNLRAAWTNPRKRGRFTWRIENRLDYAMIVNYGGYIRVGPGTRPGGGFILPGGLDVPSGIYSRKKPEGMLQQAMAKASLELPEAVRRATRAVR